MNALEVSQRSTDAWNRHDADALVAVYAEGGRITSRCQSSSMEYRWTREKAEEQRALAESFGFEGCPFVDPGELPPRSDLDKCQESNS